MAASTPDIHPYFRIPEGPEIRDRLGLRLNQALVGQMDPAEALKTANQEATDILKKAGYKF
jgi:ABC-type glycerol-3-phosphate transport system substrate-binding protein